MRIFPRIARIIYKFTILSLCILTVVVILWTLLPIEFADPDLKWSYFKFLLYAFPILFLLTLFGTLNRPNPYLPKSGIVILTVLSSAFYLLIAGSLNMCSWTTERTLFVLKSDNSTKIVERSFGCGALDSDIPKHEIHKSKPMTEYITLFTEIDTTSIEMSDWQKFNPELK